MLLNCTSPTTAAESLAAAAGVTALEVSAAVASIEWTEIDADDDPARALPRLAAGRLGCRIKAFSHARFFHGTRTRNPDSFRRRGLLPLGVMVEELWDELRSIAADRVQPANFELLRKEMQREGGGADGGYQYRLKTSADMQHGPFGEYVREHFLRSDELSMHNYLRTPELVEDIGHAALHLYGVDLLEAYRLATTPCIVAFEMPIVEDVHPVSVACWYLWAAARGVLSPYACGGFDGRGRAVPPTAIREIVMIGT